ncbi:MAG: hypothetical protein A7316_02830 [Candidatus Altiarchaeales archaeon WOR_SM1_86-2]|nr:MAG: hypothetical protein A7316_02830 [Candidatus Altiarchaeales archaeon WOR_SM1_86-2]
MQKPNRKGQGAMEYLMSYSWAILVVVIVGVTLWYMGVFSWFGGIYSFGGAPKTFTGFEEIKPLSWAVYENGSAVITMMSLDYASVTLTSVGGDCSFRLPDDRVIPPGEAFQITADAGDCPADARGTVYRMGVKIFYTTNIAHQGELHSSTGTIQGPYE